MNWGTRLAPWLVLAFALRAISAATHATPAYLDEWYQTAEFANWLTHGFMSYTQEFGLHLRNLSWPWILSLGLRAAHALDSTSPALRVYFIHLVSGVVDLGLLWGWWQLMEKTKLPAFWRKIGMGLILFLPFLAADSVRPNAEHISTALFFVCLGLLARERWLAAGVFGACVAATKYTSGLLTLGALVSLLWQGRGPAARFLAGGLLGLVLTSLPDWIVYGRPWESLWMFLQYNVFSGLAAEKFGRQGLEVYLDFHRNYWTRVLAPLGLVLLAGLPRGLSRGWREKAPWLFALAFHLVPHLLVSHKEPRFIAPVELMLVWAGFLGIATTFAARDSLAALFPRRWARVVFVIACCVFIGSYARGLWGETGKAAMTWFEVKRRLAAQPDTCAIVTVVPARSVYLPWISSDKVPEPPVATFAIRDLPSFEKELKSSRLTWVEQAPRCEGGSRFLLHLDQQRPEVLALGCELLEGSWSKGPWYSCPANSLEKFGDPVVRHLIARGRHRYESLPGLGIGPWELFELGRGNSGDPAPDDEAL